MYNEVSCRACGMELTPVLKCKYCDETYCWICMNCEKRVQRIHVNCLEHSSYNLCQNRLLGSQITG